MKDSLDPLCLMIKLPFLKKSEVEYRTKKGAKFQKNGGGGFFTINQLTVWWRCCHHTTQTKAR